MGKEKVTATVDRAKLEEARRLSKAASISATIDVALTELIRSERIRQDLAAYVARPIGDDEFARVAADWSDLADDTDWARLYRDENR